MPLVEKHRDGAAEDVEEEDAALVDARALLGSRGPSLSGGLRRSGTGLAGDGRPGAAGGGSWWWPAGRVPLFHHWPVARVMMIHPWPTAYEYAVWHIY